MIFTDLYEQYLSLNITNNKGFIDVKCPIHNDNGPSAGVDLNTGIFNCFVCGKMSAEQFLVKMNGMSLSEASYTVSELLVSKGAKVEKKEDDLSNGFSLKWAYNKRFDKLYDTCDDLNDESDITNSYIGSRGLSIDTLINFGIKTIKANLTPEVWNRDSLVFPYFHNGKIVGIRYRDIHGNKYAEKGSYLLPWGVDYLDTSVNTVLVTEGESDALRLSQSVPSDSVRVVGLPGARFPAQWVREFTDIDNIIFIPQADIVAKKVIDEANKVLDKSRFSVIELPWKRGQIGKDICDWLCYNKVEELTKRVESRITTTKKVYYTGVELKALKDEADDNDYLVSNLIMQGQIIGIGGKMKSRKTWLALELLRTIICPDEKFVGIDHFIGKGNANTKVLVVEEEGNRKKFVNRLDKVFSNLEWENNITLAHRLGIKLDSDQWLERLIHKIEEGKYEVVLFDPLQNLHSRKENENDDMKIVWESFHTLVRRFKQLTIIFVHHFGKTGDIRNGLDAFRGASTIGGQVDLGILVRRDSKGTSIKFVGRDEEEFESPDGTDIYKLDFNEETLRISLQTRKVEIDEEGDKAEGHMLLYEFFVGLKKTGTGKMSLSNVASYFGKSTKTIHNWVDKLGDDIISVSKPTKGKPVMLELVGEMVIMK